MHTDDTLVAIDGIEGSYRSTDPNNKEGWVTIKHTDEVGHYIYKRGGSKMDCWIFKLGDYTFVDQRSSTGSGFETYRLVYTGDTLQVLGLGSNSSERYNQFQSRLHPNDPNSTGPTSLATAEIQELCKEYGDVFTEIEASYQRETPDDLSPESLKAQAARIEAASQGAPSAKVSDALTALIKKAGTGDASAQVELGRAYYTGKGAPKDLDKAKLWFSKAAAAGSAVAQLNLGNYYKEQANDDERAADYWEMAADQHLPQAEYALGCAYEENRGRDEDLRAALDYFRRAAVGGCIPAALRLGKHLVADDDKVESQDGVRWLIKAADGGEAEAQYLVGVLYATGTLAKASHLMNTAKALAYLQKAADQNNALALLALGGLYYTGSHDVPLDKKHGIELVTRSANLGDLFANAARRYMSLGETSDAEDADFNSKFEYAMKPLSEPKNE